MVCPRCGKEIQLSDDSRFCPGCGLEFQRAPIQEPPKETNCPNCNAIIQPDAKFCPMCGKEVTIQQQIQPLAIQENEYQVEQYRDETINRNIDIQTQLAQKELDKINSKNVNETRESFAVIGLLAIAILAFAVGAILPGIIFALLFIVYTIKVGNRINRKKELEHLAAGEKIVNVCPKCKSENIEMSMVQTGGYTTHGTSRVSNNINPLHPFTHTNVKKGEDYNFATYGNQCHCRNCGFVFTKPEVHYIK